MQEVIVASRETRIEGHSAVFVKPGQFLGSSFSRYLDAVSEAKGAVYLADQNRMVFDKEEKCHRLTCLATEVESVIATISQVIWDSGFAVVSGAAPAPKTEKVEVQGILDLFDRAGRTLKFPKITLEAKNGQTVTFARAGSRSRYEGSVMVTDGGSFGNNTYFGRIATDGELTPSRSMTEEVIDLLRDLSLDAAKVAAGHGRKTGICCFCRRDLRKSDSVKVGYGQVCAEKFCLPYGEPEATC